MSVDPRWLDPAFVKARLAESRIYGCSRESNVPQRNACLEELRIGADGLLYCPIHGKDFA